MNFNNFNGAGGGGWGAGSGGQGNAGAGSFGNAGGYGPAGNYGGQNSFGNGDAGGSFGSQYGNSNPYNNPQQLTYEELEYLSQLQQQQQAQLLNYQQEQALNEQLQQQALQESLQQQALQQQLEEQARQYQYQQQLQEEQLMQQQQQWGGLNTAGLPQVSQEQIQQNSMQAQNIANMILARQQAAPQQQPMAQQYIPQVGAQFGAPQYVQETPQYVPDMEQHYMFNQDQLRDRPDVMFPDVRYNGEMAQMMQGPGSMVPEETGVMTTMDYLYLLMAFIVFSVSVAVVRRQFTNLTQKTNIKKAVKSRFSDVFGRGNGPNRSNNNNNDLGADSNDQKLIFGQGDNEAGSSSNKKKITYTNKDKSSISQSISYLQTSMDKVMGKKKDKDSDGEEENTGNDPYEYEVLDSYNKEQERQINFNTEQTKNLWTQGGMKKVDEKGKEITKNKEESKSNDVLDGSKEGDDKESPVALLSAMDLNCDDDKINTLVDNPETGSRGSTAAKATEIGSSILKKLNLNKKPTKKAAVVIDDDDENEPKTIQDSKDEQSTATDQTTINHVVDELNDLMQHTSNDATEQAFMKIDDNL